MDHMFCNSKSVDTLSFKHAVVLRAYISFFLSEEIDQQTECGSIIYDKPRIFDVLWLDDRHSQIVFANFYSSNQQLIILMFESILVDCHYFFLPTEKPKFERVGEVQLSLLVFVKTFVGLSLVTILCDLTFIGRCMVAQSQSQ